MPDILVMENVPEVVGSKNIKHFQKWRAKLEQLGYSNFDMILNAKDYGIPQNRRRCFMVSVLGNYSYHFPMKMKLENRLIDLQEDNVDEKYFLTRKMLEYVTGINYDNEKFDRSKMFFSKLDNVNKSGIAGTITTREGSRSCDTFLIEGGVPVMEKTKKGHNVAKVGDGVDISTRMQYHRGTVQKGISQTLTCQGGNNVGVVVPLKQELCEKLIREKKVKEGDIVKHSYTNQILLGNKKAVEKEGEMITLTTRGDCVGICVKDGTILRIRKLTPLECVRLMGFTRKDYDALREIGMSDAAIYHMMGDSIVVTVLVGIFSMLIKQNIREHILTINNYLDSIKE